jgi:diadenosine tetraphosphate (Ap4A) HIT family hydrolase
MEIAVMRSGIAVMGDTQQLPGYCVLRSADEAADHLTDLGWAERRRFLFDLALLGEAVAVACRDGGLRRVNYEVLGNTLPRLHGHVHARYAWEPPELIGGPVWCYPSEVRNDPRHAYSETVHGALRERIAAELDGIVAAAYAQVG